MFSILSSLVSCGAVGQLCDNLRLCPLLGSETGQVHVGGMIICIFDSKAYGLQWLRLVFLVATPKNLNLGRLSKVFVFFNS